MTDAELRDQALAELRQTTRGLKGFSAPKGSHWRNALDLLAEIGVKRGTTTPPPVVASRVQLAGANLIAMVASAKRGVPSFVPAGTYATAAEVVVPDGANIEFRSVVIVPSDEDHSAMVVTGTGTKLFFRGTCAIQGSAGSRGAIPYQAGMLLLNLHDFEITVDTLVVSQTKTVGWFLSGCTNGVINGSLTNLNTKADGFHVTGASTDITINAHIYSTGCGDDGCAVASYVGDGDMCRRITFAYVRVRNGTGGRGIACQGGEDITFTYADIDGTPAAGMYVSSETFWDNYGINRMSMTGKVRNPNTSAIHHSSVVFINERVGLYAINAAVVVVDPDPGYDEFQRESTGSITNSTCNGTPVT